MIKKAMCIIIISLIFLTSCVFVWANVETASSTKLMMDTIIEIKLYYKSGLIDSFMNNDSKKYDKILANAMELCQGYEQLFSRTIDTSDVSRINNAGGKPVVVDDDTIEIIRDAIHYNEISSGTFDITIGGVSELWHFSQESPIKPTDEAIKTAIKTVGCNNIVIDRNTVTLKNPHTKIDLGGIAKGYIADKIHDYLKSENCSGVINLGGNIMTVGKKPGGKSWKIGIQKPFELTSTMLASVQVGEKSVVSSGVYERFFYDQNGKFYHHILNPDTGYPVDTDIVSVSIISDRSIDGDGLSTGIFVLGLTDGLALIESLEGVEAVFIKADGSIISSSGIGTEIPIAFNE